MILIFVFAGIIVSCNDAGCMQISTTTFNAMMVGGVLELVFEVVGLAKIFRKKQ